MFLQISMLANNILIVWCFVYSDSLDGKKVDEKSLDAGIRTKLKLQ